MDKEEPKENEIWCVYCGIGEVAVWQLVTGEGELFVCDNHYFELRRIHVVGLERKVGDEEWKEVFDFEEQDPDEKYFPDFGDWKDLIDNDDL